MQILYDIAVVLLVIILMPYFFYRLCREDGFGERLKQSFGFLPRHALDKVAKKNCIWIHAASVGEIVATSPLVREIKKEIPDQPILISVVTCSGYVMAKRIIEDADSIIYFPLDLPFLATHIVKKIRPLIFLPVETELWPNLLKAARKYNVAVMMVNGRISDKSVKRYRYMFSLLSDMIGTVNKFAMQSQIDASYIIRLGADPKLVTVTGNTKFDQTYTTAELAEKEELLRQFGLSDEDKIIIAGSTHKGEEEYVLEAFQQVRQKDPTAKLIIAPRKIIRKADVYALAEQYGFRSMYRTDPAIQTKPYDVLVLDTIGELGRVYSIATVVYVGGSLVAHGGHNILEPASHGKAIVVGRYMFNFKDTYTLFSKRSACSTVQNSAELAIELIRLLTDKVAREAMEAESLQIICENRGASKRTAIILRRLLDDLEANEKMIAVPSSEPVENVQTYLFDLVHSTKRKTFWGRIIVSCLWIFSRIYQGLVNLKLWLYKNNFLHREDINCFVISIGNITVGGTGKTPTAQKLAKDIRNMGYKVAILNRGYRAKWTGDVGVVSDGKKLLMSVAEAGDEAYLLAKSLPDVPILIGPDRSLTGKYAIEHFGTEVAILDDGYQHWQLQRDMDILLVDAINIFGNEYVLPRGTLREELSHVDRADVCLLTKVDQAAPNSCAYIHSVLKKYNPQAQIVESIHNPKGFIEIADWSLSIAQKQKCIQDLAGQHIIAVSAIGNPASLEQTLQSIGTVIVQSIRYPDHHDYAEQEIEDILMQAEKVGADAIIITDKDAVKFPLSIVQKKDRLPIYIISIEIKFQAGAQHFTDYLRSSLKQYFAVTK